MEILGALLFLIIQVLISIFLLLGGARIANIRDANFDKAVRATVIIWVASTLFRVTVGQVSGFGWFLALLLSLAVAVVATLAILETSFRKSLIAVIFLVVGLSLL